MITTGSVGEVTALCRAYSGEGLRLGFVPTMGFLHEGHGSLIKRCVAECDRTIVSIFVNPTQFGPSEDLSSYPRDLASDLSLCENLGADLIFAPADKSELYPPGFATSVVVSGLTDLLCGHSRPGHFAGVTQIVAKLLNITGANKAYFGLKDYQQVRVIQRMVADLNLGTEIVACPIVRDDDGVAMSSRNAYLSVEQRKRASALHESLALAQEFIDSGERDPRAAEALASKHIESILEEGDKIDYVKVLDAMTLAEIDVIKSPAVMAMAVFFGKTRLLDNRILGAS